MGARKKVLPDFSKDKPQTLDAYPFYGLVLDAEQLCFANAIWNPDIDIVWVNARAGCGKTVIAAGVANLLVQYGEFQEIIYIMSPYGERKQGWLPGTITEKSSVYFEPFYQALITCNVNPTTAVNTDTMVNQKNGTGYITCITDTFLRGATLNDAVVILDECQNYTLEQLKTILTRVGSHCKVIVIGHDQQCDLDDPGRSGFLRYMQHFSGKERCAVCVLTRNYRSWISSWADEL